MTDSPASAYFLHLNALFEYWKNDTINGFIKWLLLKANTGENLFGTHSFERLYIYAERDRTKPSAIRFVFCNRNGSASLSVGFNWMLFIHEDYSEELGESLEDKSTAGAVFIESLIQLLYGSIRVHSTVVLHILTIVTKEFYLQQERFRRWRTPYLGNKPVHKEISSMCSPESENLFRELVAAAILDVNQTSV
jgi:hypothetical protein